MSIMTGAKNVATEWVYNARNTLESIQSAGLLYNTLPAALQLTEQTTLGDICAQIRDQLDRGIEYRVCPYGYDDIHPDTFSDTMLDIIYQEGAAMFTGERKLLRLEREETRRNAAACQTFIEAEIWDEGDEDRIYFEYSASRYSAKTIERFGKLLTSLVEAMLEHCENPDMTVRELISNTKNAD